MVVALGGVVCAWRVGEGAEEVGQVVMRARERCGGGQRCLRPYHPENARSRLISEAKQGRARLVLGWETAWEYRVL